MKFKHGHTAIHWKSKTYVVWSGMKQRCYNKNCPTYQYYGEKGIKVCKRWMKFENFLEDMGNRPRGQVIDRINNLGNYTPSNCRWVPYKQSALNCGRNVHLKLNGDKRTAKEWQDQLGIKASTLIARKKRGWSDEECLKTKVRGHVWIQCFGRTMILKDWERWAKIPQQTIQHRLAKGWNLEEALTKRPRKSRWSK